MFRREKSCDKDKKSDKQPLVKQKSIGLDSAKTDIFKALSFKEKSKQTGSLLVSKSADQKVVRKSDKKDSDKNIKSSTSFCRSKISGSRSNKDGLKQDDFLKATMRIFLVVSPPVGRMQVFIMLIL